jgi:biopolymer transport protein ExbD
MTPMIDVVFNLLIFFMVISDLTQREMESLALPYAEEAVEEQPARRPERVTVNVAKAGDWVETGRVRVMIGGREYDWQQLKEYLYVAAQRGMAAPGKPSEVPVLIRCDREIRWREVQWVMQACADSAIRMYRLEFATSERGEP